MLLVDSAFRAMCSTGTIGRNVVWDNRLIHFCVNGMAPSHCPNAWQGEYNVEKFMFEKRNVIVVIEKLLWQHIEAERCIEVVSSNASEAEKTE